MTEENDSTIASTLIIDGRYKVISILGEGGMGTVYRCFDTVLNRDVAVKKLLPRFAGDNQALGRIHREAQAVSRLQHRNIIQVYDFRVAQDNSPILVMQFVAGQTLDVLLREKKRLPQDRAIGIALQACQALEHAHGNGILHRDIKPSNIMLDNVSGIQDFVRILDFGIAKLNLPDEDGAVQNRLTTTGQIIGTPLYLSPEQIDNQAVPASDQYALACVLFEMLTGRVPIEGRTAIDTILKHKTDPPLTLNAACSDIKFSARLEEIMATALAKNPADRYGGLAQFRVALARLGEFDLPQSVTEASQLKSADFVVPAAWSNFSPTTSGATKALMESQPEPAPDLNVHYEGSANTGLLTLDTYAQSLLCPPFLHSGKPNAVYDRADGRPLPLGFVGGTVQPAIIRTGRLPNREQIIFAPPGSEEAKALFLRSFCKGLLHQKGTIVCIESGASLKQRKVSYDGYVQDLLNRSKAAGFVTSYFQPGDKNSFCWNPMDVSPEAFSASILTEPASASAQIKMAHNRDEDILTALVKILKMGAIRATSATGEGLKNQPLLPCTPRNLMLLLNDRASVVDSLKRLQEYVPDYRADTSEIINRLSNIIIKSDAFNDGLESLRFRLRMFKNQTLLQVTDRTTIDITKLVTRPSTIIFGTGPMVGDDDPAQLIFSFLHQLHLRMHYVAHEQGVIPIHTIFSEYETLNLPIIEKLKFISPNSGGGLALCLNSARQFPKNSSPDWYFDTSALRLCFGGADDTTVDYWVRNLQGQVSKYLLTQKCAAEPGKLEQFYSRLLLALPADAGIASHSPFRGNHPNSNSPPVILVDARGLVEIDRVNLLHRRY